jgi:hypothetical protein
MTTMEIGGSQDDRFTLKKFQECVYAWRDKNNLSKCILNISRTTKTYDFVFGQLNFQN